jgi:hypothetical protein
MYFHIADLTTEEEATLKYIDSTSWKHKIARIKDIIWIACSTPHAG